MEIQPGTRLAAPVELILYVTPSPASVKARKAVEAFIATHPRAACRMTVRDVDECWEAAEEDRILFAPTLVVKGDGPPAWLVGDMGNPETLAALIHVGEPEECS
jgi:hypothetical protein